MGEYMGEVQGELQGQGWGDSKEARGSAGKLLAPPQASLLRLGGIGCNRAVGAGQAALCR